MAKTETLIEKTIGGVKYLQQPKNVGDGHMGVVSFAKDINGNSYAIKRFKDKENDDAKRRIFLESGEAMKTLGNQGLKYLVNTFYAGRESDGESYIVMEAMEQNLDQVISHLFDKKKLDKKDLALAYTYTYNLFNAFNELHQQTYKGEKVTHNDPVPTNVLVSGKRLKLTDLITIPSDMPQNEAQKVINGTTIHYLMGGSNIHKTRYRDYISSESPSVERDVYLAGLMAIELLTGDYAIKGKSKGIAEVNTANGNPEINKSIADIIQKTTSALIKERHSTKDVIDTFTDIFKEGNPSFSEEYFCRLDIGDGYEIISRPADRFKQLLEMSLAKPNYSIDDIEKKAKLLNKFNEITGVTRSEQKEMKSYFSQYNGMIKESLESKQSELEEVIELKDAKIETEREKSGKEIEILEKSLDPIDFSTMPTGYDKTLKDARDNKISECEEALKSTIAGINTSKNAVTKQIESLTSIYKVLDMTPDQLIARVTEPKKK